MKAREARRLADVRLAAATYYGDADRSAPMREMLARHIRDGSWDSEYDADLLRQGKWSESDVADAVANQSCDVLAGAAREWDPYYVTATMTDVLEMASLDVPAFDLAPYDLMTPNGFVLFDRTLVGLPLLDDQPRIDEVGIDGIMWTMDPAVDDKVMIATFGLAGRPANTPAFATMPPWHTVRFGRPWDQSGSVVVTVFAAFWRLIQQPFVSRISETLDRGSQRRLARGAVLPATTTMITIRKSPSRHADGGEGGPVDWQHRWLVRGHWRQQWYPSQQRHAPLFIPPYVKGPDDKPFEAKGRIFDVKR